MISFVLLHYQAFEETISCVNAIDKNILSDKYIVIIDNNSPNRTGEKLRKYFQDRRDVIVHITEKNLGFAKGNNIGFKIAKKAEPTYIVVMNNDVMLVDADMPEKLDKAYEETEFDILGPDIFSTRGNYHQNPQRENNYSLKELRRYAQKTRFKLEHKWMIRIKYLLPLVTNKSEHKSSYISNMVENCVLHGACYVYSPKYIQSHDNCFYEGTFMYFESYILHYLAMREGLKMVYYPEIKVEHHEDVATDQVYTNKYKKSIFTNQCLLDSCNEFIRVMNNREIRIE